MTPVKVRELPKFKCALILYVGPGPRIGDAWQALYQAIRAKGLKPNGRGTGIVFVLGKR